MKLFTIHETKRTSFGVFRRRILCLQKGVTVLTVTPCIRPECPDLGFKILNQSELQNSRFKESREVDSLSEECLSLLCEKLESENLSETDSLFSSRWFEEVARITEVSQYRLQLSSLVKEGS